MKFKNGLITKTILGKYMLIMFLALHCGLSAQTDKLIVRGIVTGENSLPIPGVSILLEKNGKQTGAISDFDGAYSIEANVGDILMFTYLGMISQKVKIEGAQLNVVLREDIDELDTVVVIGFGAVKKKEIIGAVAQVKASEIENVITGDISSALQGQVAGVSVTANGGEPGEGSGILIRGISSLTGSNSPLFVVDGVPQAGDPGLNPNEIETIDILKDAASASIYGTRAAGGVILITTKRGQEGNTKIDLNINSGIQRITRETPLMNTEEQIFFDSNDQSRGTALSPARFDRFSLLNDNDARDLVQNNFATISRYNLSITGGTKDSNYSFVLGYFDQEGSVLNSRLQRYNLRSNVQVSKNKWTINNGFGFTIDDRERPNFNLLLLSQRAFPYLDKVDENSNNIIDDSGDNERLSNLNGILGALTRTRELGRYRFEASSNIGYKINDHLELKTLISGVVTNEFEKQVQPAFQVFDQEGNPTRSEFDNFVYESRSRRILINWNGSINYNQQFGKHNFTGLALASIEEDNFTSIGAFVQGLTFNNPRNLSLGAVDANATSNGLLNRGTPIISPDFRTKRIGTIGRVLYDYDGKYLLSVSGRLDGSNQFSTDNRFAFFPSASLGWNVSEEKFWENIKPLISSLKLRASIGTTGNDRFATNSFKSVVITGFDVAFQNQEDNSSILNPGVGQSRFANPDLKWEVTTQRNIGLDLSFWKNKLVVTADYYNSEKKDLLVGVPINSSFGAVPPGDIQAGQRNTTFNIGDLTNQGFETSIRYRPKTGNVRWNILGTFTTNKNEVKNIDGNVDQLLFNNIFPVFGDGVSIANGLKVGREAGSFLLFPTDGLLKTETEVNAYNAQFGTNAEVGDLKYVDTDGDGVIRNEGDRVYKGSGLPDFEVGLNLSATYKNFYFATNWFASVGNEVYNATRANAINDRRSKDLIYQFIPGVNEDTNIPTYRGRTPLHNNFRPDTDLFIEDGSFVRLRNVVVAYTLPKDVSEKLGFSRINFYANGQNVLTITDYTGLDPEVGGNNIQRKGLDSGVLPITASYNLGLRLNF
ncbi:hypothetical protein A8C32_07655 [Flavivirga aquatica]|uniref:SusC/RagA family TonB-linked outer membrane protein n=1 Tax=Flavivirga aquatica TaxID=1849968 RepID=A0A1E5SIV2_9FLAO|nr:TonB-dependent receptor [Flavivirga aquatica]OEJ99043.1 hypothetical protein A8C32_07655 [Flavivirga aquatica]